MTNTPISFIGKTVLVGASLLTEQLTGVSATPVVIDFGLPQGGTFMGYNAGTFTFNTDMIVTAKIAVGIGRGNNAGEEKISFAARFNGTILVSAPTEPIVKTLPDANTVDNYIFYIDQLVVDDTDTLEIEMGSSDISGGLDIGLTQIATDMTDWGSPITSTAYIEFKRVG